MPASAILLSILGLVPFVGFGLGALQPDADTAVRMLTALIGWGVVVLTFVGGLHWGLVLRDPVPGPPGSASSLPVYPQGRRRHARIGLAVLPLILGWVALMLPLLTPTWLALALLIAGYIAMLAVEHRSAARVVFPARFLLLRWVVTVVAVAMLTTVLTLRLLGQTIAF